MEGYPAHELLEFCQQMEQKPGVLDCTVFHGFPYAVSSRTEGSLLAR